ncbi:MAG: hypothetical protein ACJAUP_003578 [Cellvibrionaceae bacterium]|jgi:hypothetical protein
MGDQQFDKLKENEYTPKKVHTDIYSVEKHISRYITELVNRDDKERY